MTWFSLKRTLQSNLASSIEVLNPTNQDIPRSNLHTPLRYSAVLLSIGKTTQICHQNIPLKKVNCNRTVTYVSAIPRKLEKIWQQPAQDIAAILLSRLQEQTPQSVWSSVRKTDNSWLEFIISEAGIWQWQQQLCQWPVPCSTEASPYPIASEQLWQLQSGYELCCRWQRYHPIAMPSTISSHSYQTDFLMPFQPVHHLIHCLLDICDCWHQISLKQLLQQTQQLVRALEKCIGLVRLSSEAKAVKYWVEPTRVVLLQALNQRLGYSLTARF